MRLLNTTTLTLEFFPGTAPEYAILSHRWEDEEVLYEHIRNGLTPETRTMKGLPKALGSCKLARQEGFKYIWIDTCCIDKSSSAELSESINSMFNWYRKAAVCYAFLSDAANLAQFPKSLWFTRGWTLQELIAPREVVFYNPSWSRLGSRSDLYETIGAVTRVPSTILRQELQEIGNCSSCNDGALSFVRVGLHVEPCSHHDQVDQHLAQALNGCSVAQRFSWASRRTTTRHENTAYCLLGIFGVNLPLLYGEGARAFLRLQEEIIKTTNDQSILAFTRNGPEWPFKGNDSLLARSPYLFAGLEDIRPARWADKIIMTPTAKAIETTLLMCRLKRRRYNDLMPYWIGILCCDFNCQMPKLPALLLEPLEEGGSAFRRVHSYLELRVAPGLLLEPASHTIVLRRSKNEEVWFRPEDATPMNVTLSLFSAASASPGLVLDLPKLSLRVDVTKGIDSLGHLIDRGGCSCEVFPRGVLTAGIRTLHVEGGYELWGWLELYFGWRDSYHLRLVVLFGFSPVRNGGWCRIILPDGAWKAVGRPSTLEGELEGGRLGHCKKALAGVATEAPFGMSRAKVDTEDQAREVGAKAVYSRFLDRYPVLMVEVW